MEIIGVTNRKLAKDFYERIREISKENTLKYLILREKDLTDEELEIMAVRIKGILKNSNIKLIINSNIRVADNVNAYGVQLSFKDFISKKDIVDNLIIGVSVHSYNEAVIAEKGGADYIIYGHLYETKCKLGVKPRGLVEFEKICKKLSIPVYGIGGIDENNCNDVMKAGAKGISIMSKLMNK